MAASRRLIKNGSKPKDLTNWEYQDVSITGSSYSYFSIAPGGYMKQKVKLPKSYPETLRFIYRSIQQKTSYISNTMGHLEINYSDTSDVVSIPSIGPLYQNDFTDGEGIWNIVSTSYEVRPMPEEGEQGSELKSIEVIITNSNNFDMLIDEIELFHYGRQNIPANEENYAGEIMEYGSHDFSINGVEFILTQQYDEVRSITTSVSATDLTTISGSEIFLSSEVKFDPETNKAASILIKPSGTSLPPDGEEVKINIQAVCVNLMTG